MTGLYVSKLLALFGEIACHGRTGRLHLSKILEGEGGTLRFAGGLLAGFTPPASDTQPVEPAGEPITVLRQRIALAITLASENHGALPGFSSTPDTGTPSSDATAPGLNAADLAIDLCRHIEDQDLLDRHIKELRPKKLVLTSRPPAVQPHAALGAVEGFLLSRADGALTCQELLDTSPLGEQVTIRALVALCVVGLLTGDAARVAGSTRATVAVAATTAQAGRLSSLDRFLQKTSAPATPAPAQREIIERVSAPGNPVADEQAEREELLLRSRSLKGLDHYGALGVERSADEAAIRRAYYQLARRYHPDRLLKPHLEDLIRELEGMFAVFTEAYNTLTDAPARAEYDRENFARAGGGRKESGADRNAAGRDAYLRGRKEMEAGRLFEALRLFESAIERDPSRSEYYHHLGVCQGENPRWRKKAEENLSKAIQLNPGAVQSYLGLARIYRKGKLERKSLEQYEKALQWDPSCEEALAALGRVATDPHDATSTGMLRSLFKKD